MSTKGKPKPPKWVLTEPVAKKCLQVVEVRVYWRWTGRHPHRPGTEQFAKDMPNKTRIAPETSNINTKFLQTCARRGGYQRHGGSSGEEGGHLWASLPLFFNLHVWFKTQRVRISSQSEEGVWVTSLGTSEAVLGWDTDQAALLMHPSPSCTAQGELKQVEHVWSKLTDSYSFYERTTQKLFMTLWTSSTSISFMLDSHCSSVQLLTAKRNKKWADPVQRLVPKLLANEDKTPHLKFSLCFHWSFAEVPTLGGTIRAPTMAGGRLSLRSFRRF